VLSGTTGCRKGHQGCFIARALPLPYVHDISDLLLRLERSGLEIPESVKSASRLTPFAVQTRYPGFEFPVSAEEYTEALALAKISGSLGRNDTPEKA